MFVVRMICAIVFLALTCPAVEAAAPRFSRTDYRNPSLPPAVRARLLLKKMTQAEKLGQLRAAMDAPSTEKPDDGHIGNLTTMINMHKGKEAAEAYNNIIRAYLSSSRLGIPALMHDEAVLGLKGNGATAFPQPLAQAATWNVDLLSRAYAAIAAETRSRGIRQVLSPNVNITQDPRWGRAHETFGEDPWLVGTLGVAFVKAFEGRGIITTPKHFVANHGDQGRNFFPTSFAERFLREYHFPPFERAVREGGATSLMVSYNTNDGIACSANPWLTETLLRKEWGFSGFVSSDYFSIPQLASVHHVAADAQDAATQALLAGVEVELPRMNVYGAPLEAAMKAGRVSAAALDRAVFRVLTAKFKIGLFEDPWANPEEAARVNDSAEHRALAREVAQQSIVLLKNKDNTLPLAPTLKTIAVLGPLADDLRLGNYAPWGVKTVSTLDGIREAFPKAKITHERAIDLEGTALPALPRSFFRPSGKDWPNAQGLRGEYWNNEDLSGPPVLVRLDPGVDFNWGEGFPDPRINPDHFSARWTGTLTFPETKEYQLGLTFNNGARLFIDGKQVAGRWRQWGPGNFIRFKFAAQKGRAYDLKLEFFEGEGTAAAVLGGEADLEDNIRKAVAVAKAAEVAVIVVGALDGEGLDRARLELSKWQERLIQAVAGAGVKTVVVLQTGNVIAAGRWIGDVDAVIEAWYPGEEGGHAIADVLKGIVNPGGKLPITFARETGQVPNYYNMKPPAGAAGNYVDAEGDALFPFGFGLSYTAFSYDKLTLSHKQAQANQQVRIAFELTNTGKRLGDEVVQLYVSDPVSSVARPKRMLVDFQRVRLQPGQTTSVVFDLPVERLALWNTNMKRVVEPGAYEIQVGAASNDIRLRDALDVTAGESVRRTH